VGVQSCPVGGAQRVTEAVGRVGAVTVLHAQLEVVGGLENERMVRAEAVAPGSSRLPSR
jgi:hypothetical protein